MFDISTNPLWRKRATYLAAMLMFNRRIRDQKQGLDTIEGMFERGRIIVVSFADGRSSESLLFQLFWAACNQSKAFGRKSTEDVFDSATTDASGGGEDTDIRWGHNFDLCCFWDC